MASEQTDPLKDLDYTEAQQALTARTSFEGTLIENPWGLSPKGLEARKAQMSALSTKTGLYAHIPIICKGDACPYAQTCQLLPYELAPEGEYCPREIAKIELLTQGYISDFNADDTSFIDRKIVSEVVSLDIMIARCEALMAAEGTPVINVTIGLSDHGDEIRQPAVSKAWEAMDKMIKRKTSLIEKLATTNDIKSKNKQEVQTSWLDAINATITQEDIQQVGEGDNSAVVK